MVCKGTAYKNDTIQFFLKYNDVITQRKVITQRVFTYEQVIYDEAVSEIHVVYNSKWINCDDTVRLTGFYKRGELDLKVYPYDRYSGVYRVK